MCVCVCVCVCVLARARVCVCVFTSIHREGFLCLDQVGYQETDRRCCVGDVPNLYNLPLYPVRTLEAGEATTQLEYVSLSEHGAFFTI